MSDLRELTDAELDIVGGGLTSVRGCSTATATFAMKREPTSCGENLVTGLIVDILRFLEPQKATAKQF